MGLILLCRKVSALEVNELWVVGTARKDGLMIRKWPAKHAQLSYYKPKFLVTTEAYLSTTFDPNLSYLFWFMPWSGTGFRVSD